MNLQASNNFVRWVPHVAAGLMLLTSFWGAYACVSGLTSPAEIDMYRDMGVTQGFLDGDWLGDSAYRGEARWYPPVVPALGASLVKLLDVSVRAYYARAGLYLNLFGAIAFYVAVRAFAGSWAAVGAFAIYLFWHHSRDPGWEALTYAPWLWPFNVTQVLTFGTVRLWLFAQERRSWRLDVVVGLALAATFLAHPAPALVIALAFCVAVAYSHLHQTDQERRAELLRLLRVGAASFVVAAPVLWPLVSAYGLQTQNDSPAYNYGIAPRNVVRELISPAGVLIVVGVVAWFRGRSRLSVPRRRTALALALAVVALLGYALFEQKLYYSWGIRLPALVPSYHFHLYFTALTAALGGVGFSAVRRVIATRVPSGDAAVVRPLVGVALVAILVIPRLPAYGSRRSLVELRSEALALAARSDIWDAYAFALNRAEPSDVFVANEELSVFAVGAAGRKVVAVDENHSNPYVDWERRARDNREMMKAFADGDWERFARIARRYEVTYYVASPTELVASPAPDEGPFVIAWRSPSVVILRYESDGTASAQSTASGQVREGSVRIGL